MRGSASLEMGNRTTTQEFSIGHIKFEMPISHPNEAVE